MTNEEFNKKMDFIVEQQAQFAADMIELRERQLRTESIFAEAGDIVTRLARATLEGFKDVNAKINALIDRQIRTDEQMRLTGEQMRLTGEQMRLTDIRLKALAESQDRTDTELRRTEEALRKFLESQGRNGLSEN